MKRLVSFVLLSILVAACSSTTRHGSVDREPESVNTDGHKKPDTPDLKPEPAPEPDSPDPAILSLEELNQQGRWLMREKQWAKAIPYFERATTLTSDPHDEYYNLACCHARLGKKEQAIESLLQAYETGVDNYPYVAADQDLALLKGFKPFDDFMATFKAWWEAARAAEGDTLYVQSPSLSEIRLRLPLGYDKAKRYPLVIGLHEYGGNARRFAPLYDSLAYKDDFIFAAIDAPYAVPASDENPSGRWWWLFDSPDDGWMRSRAATVQLVLAARERLLKDYSVDEKNIYLLGYRQGGTAAMLVCSTEWKKFSGFISIGAHHLGDEPKIEGAFQCLLCHARDDEKLSFDSCTHAREIWTKGGATVSVEELTQWREIGADSTSAITSWLHDRFGENSGD